MTPESPSSDEKPRPPGELLAAARAGDRDAAAEVQRLLLHFARQACRRGPAGSVDLDWEDIAQEAGRRLYSSGVRQYRSEGSERSYLYSIVKATVIDLARRSEARERWHEGAELPQVTPPPNPGPRLDVQRILRELPDVCRRLVVRVYLYGASYAILAHELQIEEVSVRARLSRCLRQAREIAQREGWR